MPVLALSIRRAAAFALLAGVEAWAWLAEKTKLKCQSSGLNVPTEHCEGLVYRDLTSVTAPLTAPSYKKTIHGEGYGQLAVPLDDDLSRNVLKLMRWIAYSGLTTASTRTAGPLELGKG